MSERGFEAKVKSVWVPRLGEFDPVPDSDVFVTMKWTEVSMGLFKKIFGESSKNELREDGVQQLEAILQQKVSAFKANSLWVIGRSENNVDTEDVYVLMTDVKFCYVYRINETGGMLAVSDAFITSEEEFIGFDFSDNGNNLSVHVDSLHGSVDFTVDSMVSSILGSVKIVRSQGRELMVLKNIIFPNYRAMCQEKKIDKSRFTGVREVVKSLPASVRESIKDSIKKGDMLQATKHLREATGYGLAEVKEIVERQDFYLML